MQDTKMKYGITSAVIALIGIFLALWLHLEATHLYKTHMENAARQDMFIIAVDLKLKLIASIVPLITLALGIKSVRKGNRIGLIGIIFSIILFLLIFIPIWLFFV